MYLAGWHLIALIAALLLASPASASIGDRLPEFKECLAICEEANCKNEPTSIPLIHRLLLWNCPSECGYTCQHIVTSSRLHRDPPYLSPVVQFHGKWPFHRFLGMQEPFSVLFSFFNYAGNAWGLSQARAKIPASYPLRKYTIMFGYVGLVSWAASMVFHTRDYPLTEKVDYFAAGANVLYGLYYAPIRLFRLDNPPGDKLYKNSLLRLWTLTCLLLYTAHVSFLSFVRWDYTYNMAANIAVGIVSNILWVGYSYARWRKSGKTWHLWPAMIVLWVVLAMSMEVLDFVPWRLMIDAHSLWHLGTAGPTVWWCCFLIKDAEEDIKDSRLKA